jgi:hypothetical protein
VGIRKGSKMPEHHKKVISNANKGRTFTKEHRERIGNANRGRPVSEATKAILREIHRPWSEESKKKLSASLKGRVFTEEHKQKIKATREFLKSRPNTWQPLPVSQYDLSGNFIRDFASQKEASIFMGIKGDGVGACCRGKQKSAYGYVWKFKNK